jgi:hypothetical protein
MKFSINFKNLLYLMWEILYSPSHADDIAPSDNDIKDLSLYGAFTDNLKSGISVRELGTSR